MKVETHYVPWLSRIGKDDHESVFHDLRGLRARRVQVSSVMLDLLLHSADLDLLYTGKMQKASA